MWLKRFLIVALVTITFDVTASIILDTRVDLDFSKPGRTSVVYDNVGEQIAIEFDEFDPQTIYMNVRNSLDRSQLLDGIRFSITDNLVIRSMRQFGGRDGEKGVEVQVKYFNDRPGRWDVIFDTRNPLSTGTAFANHSGELNLLLNSGSENPQHLQNLWMRCFLMIMLMPDGLIVNLL